MKKTFILYSSILLALAIVGCRKYVEIDQPGQRTLMLTSDYAALLNNSYNMTTSYTLPWVFADDLDIQDPTLQNGVTNTVRQAYTFQADLYGTSEDGDWTRLYKQIYISNQVTDGVMDSREGTLTQKQGILANAKVFRAMAYFDLINMYAKHYDEGTATSDLGVPLMTHPVFNVDLTRASVQAVYDLISQDLKEALPYLTNTPVQVVLPSKTGAFALLARQQLFMGHYEEARRYADSSLALYNNLLDLNQYANGETYPTQYQHPEILFNRNRAGLALTNYTLSQELQDLFDKQDLRWKVYTRDGSDPLFYTPFKGRAFMRNRLDATGGTSIGLDVPEVMLTKAEGLARTGKPAEAIEVLNTLRKKRFTPADYQDLSASNADEALQLVLDERRRELMGRGIRFFDQKRLNKEARFAKTVTRVFLGETYTLEPNSNRYVFPIATNYINLNPEIVQNPR